MSSVSRRTFLTAAGAATGVALSGASTRAPAQTQKETQVSVLTSPAGSGPYTAWGVLQTRARENHPWLRVVASETPGFNYNVTYLARSPQLWANTLIGSGSVLEWAALQGLKPFYQEPLKEVENFRIIGVMGLTGSVWVATDKAIQKPSDFAGKRVATGLLTQNEWGMYPRMMLDGMGLTPKLKSLNPLGTDKNVEALLDGRADVSTLVVFSNLDFSNTILPGPFKLLEAAQREWHYVSVPSASVEDYNKTAGADFHVRRYPPNTLPNQPQEVTTYGNYLLLSAHKTFPDDLAYEFAKLWVNMGPVVARYDAMGKIWNGSSLASAAKRTPDKIHPGAMRAYKDLNLLS